MRAKYHLMLCFTMTAATVGQTRADILIGVTGDGAATPESLFRLSQVDGSATFIMGLGNGDDGETIGFNPVDGLLYHASGINDGDRFWESIDVSAATVVSSSQFTGANVDDESLAMTFNPTTGRFLVVDRDDELFDATLSGVATDIGDTPENLKGLAFVGSSLYGAAVFSDTLYSLNPTDGSVISSLSVTLDGNSILGMNGLALNPSTGVLWGIFRQSGGVRSLGTLDPMTGVGTSVGLLSDNFAGLAFVAVPEPSTFAILCIGCGFVFGHRVRRRHKLAQTQTA